MLLADPSEPLHASVSSHQRHGHLRQHRHPKVTCSVILLQQTIIQTLKIKRQTENIQRIHLTAMHHLQADLP
jgi:hypothetical protein